MALKARLVVNVAATLMWVGPKPSSPFSSIEWRGASTLNGLGIKVRHFGQVGF
jgi:hypothetical protein